MPLLSAPVGRRGGASGPSIASVTHPIEKTLALLHDAMAAHHDALKPRPVVPASVPLGPPGDRRTALVLRLLQGVEHYAGMEIGPAVAEKLAHLLQPLGLADLDLLVARFGQLPAEDPEWQGLVESLTVHETYFMRNPAQMVLVAAHLPVLIAAAAAARRYRLRLWSVGCSTGEEAYSLAVLALEALVAAGHAVETPQGIALQAPWQLDVIGADLSQAALDQAQAGLYSTGPLSAFRNLRPDLLRFFPRGPAPQTRRVRDDVRAAVRFERFNLVRDPVPAAGFDLVSCRNVLIYLSAAGRFKARETLRRAVRRGGYLLLGATDALHGAADFETLWGEDAIIYRSRGSDA
jgi:chemotaxis protein methyltransferase CheR